jgi:Tetratricopeptide repeat
MLAAQERALAIDEAVYGPGHPEEVATSLSNLAMILWDLGAAGGGAAAAEAGPGHRRGRAAS